MPSASDRGGGADPPTGAAADELDAEMTDTAAAAFAEWRQRFRVWRRARPFWAGLWTLLAGLELALIPLSDLGRFVSSGQVAFTAVLPGIVLIIAGAFMWFSPPNRTMAGFLAMVFAVASLVLSNLGGLLIGMLLGIVGGAMAVGWTDAPRKRRTTRTRGGGTVPVVLVLVTALLTVPMVDDADARSRHCLLLDQTAPLTSGLEKLGVDLTGAACRVTAEQVRSVPLGTIIATLDPSHVDTLLVRLSAAEVLANAAGLDAAAVEPLLGPIAAETGMTTSAENGPTGRDLVDALTAALADGGTPLDLGSMLALLTDTLSGAVDADDLLNRLLTLLGDTVDEVLETVPVLPDDEASAPEPSSQAQVAAAAPTSTGGHDEGHTAPSVLSDLTLGTLDVNTLRYSGIVTVPTAGGTMDVLRFVIEEIDATGLDLLLPDGQDADFGIANHSGGSLHGVGVVLDCTRLSLTVTGAGGLVGLPTGVPLELAPGSPLLAVLGPILNGAPAGTILSTEDVDIDLVTLSVRTLDLFGVAGGAS